MAKKTSVAPSRATLATPSPLAKVTVLMARASAANAEREVNARKALARIRVLLRKSAESAWDLGHALGQFVQDKQYVALGYGAFGECLEGEKLLSENQAFKLIRVARRFSRDELTQVGSVAKADALIGYTDATQGRDTPVALVKADALIGGKRVSKASAAHIDQQAKAALAKRRTATPKNAAQVARAKAEQKREQWVGKQLAALGCKAASIATKGSKIVVELDVAKVERAMEG